MNRSSAKKSEPQSAVKSEPEPSSAKKSEPSAVKPNGGLFGSAKKSDPPSATKANIPKKSDPKKCGGLRKGCENARRTFP